MATTPKVSPQPTAGGGGDTKSPAAPKKAGPLRRVGPYQIGRTLGEGTFGRVKYALDTSTTPPTPVAIKIMDKRKIVEYGMSAQIKKEIAIMRLIANHDGVVRLLQVMVSPSTVFLVLELVTGGELFDRIVTDGKFEEDAARDYFRQLIAGLEHCHGLKIVHRDLKPENLLLDSRGRLKISDFGLSALASNPSPSAAAATASADGSGVDASIMHTACGTPNYVAPEVLMDKGYDGRAADIWSAGVILYVLLAGFLPFDENTVLELFRKIVKADFSYPNWMSPEAISLLSLILNPDPAKRATVAVIKSHPWFNAQTLPPAGGTAAPSASTLTADAKTNSTASAAATAAAAPRVPDALSVGSSTTPLIAPLHRSDSPPIEANALLPPAATAAPALDLKAPPTGHERTDGAAPPVSSSGVVVNLADAKQPSNGVGAGGSGKPVAKMNAFDLINRMGGAALHRMFSKDKDSSSRPFRQFMTVLHRDRIVPGVVAVLKSCAIPFVMSERTCKFKALSSASPPASAPAANTATAATTPTAPVVAPLPDMLFVVQVYEMTPDLHMMECRQDKADNRTFIAFYQELKTYFEAAEQQSKLNSSTASAASTVALATTTATAAGSQSSSVPVQSASILVSSSQ